MAGRSQNEARTVVEAYDFTPIETLVDVGGGQGVLLSTILAAAPAMTGTLMDREAAMPGARAWLEQSGVGDRATCVVGDFFASVAAAADAYVLSPRAARLG